MQSREIDIRLELSPQNGEIAGKVGTADAARREFSGWIGLLSALMALVDEETTCP